MARYRLYSTRNLYMYHYVDNLKECRVVARRLSEAGELLEGFMADVYLPKAQRWEYFAYFCGQGCDYRFERADQ